MKSPSSSPRDIATTKVDRDVFDEPLIANHIVIFATEIVSSNR